MGRYALVFPGQGSQTVGMGRTVWEESPAAQDVFGKADVALGRKISSVCFEGPDEELKRTENTQPAMVTTELAILAALREAMPDAPAPAYVAGHSLGEYAALAAAGVLAVEDAVRLVERRGCLMGAAAEKHPGTMAAIIALPTPEVAAVCEEAGAYVANDNCPGQVVVSGSADAVSRAGKLAQERGAKYVFPLKVSGAFHSPLMQDAANGLRESVSAANISDCRVPLVANSTAQVVTSSPEVRQELVQQLCHPVRWTESVRLMADAGVDTFVEVGPGTVLAGLIKRICPDARMVSIQDMEGVTRLSKEGL